jgi:hypothetical protein
VPISPRVANLHGAQTASVTRKAQGYPVGASCVMAHLPRHILGGRTGNPAVTQPFRSGAGPVKLMCPCERNQRLLEFLDYDRNEMRDPV